MGRRKRRRRRKKGDKGGEKGRCWPHPLSLGKSSRLFPPPPRLLTASGAPIPFHLSAVSAVLVPLLFESPLLLPFVLLSFPGRREGGREGGTVVSNELATVHFTPTVKICGGIGRRRGRRERVTAVRSSYPVICRSTRASSPPTNSGATEYLVRWHARRRQGGGKDLQAKTTDDPNPLGFFDVLRYRFPRHCVRGGDGDGARRHLINMRWDCALRRLRKCPLSSSMA